MTPHEYLAAFVVCVVVILGSLVVLAIMALRPRFVRAEQRLGEERPDWRTGVPSAMWERLNRRYRAVERVTGVGL